MRVGVGYSDNPDTFKGGVKAARGALEEARRGPPCDLALLFATARHDPHVLKDAVASELGPKTPLVGGGSVGAISNSRFGYAGDQIILAALWLEGSRCDILTEGGLSDRREEEAGRRLGRRLAALGTADQSPLMLFYDAIDRSKGDMALIMATPFLQGLEDGLGYLPPNMVGAGLMGDYACTATWQWTGEGLAQHSALALAFSGDVRLNSAVMHGCHPATGYYTVTRADHQVILEINGQPALPFINRLLGGTIPPEEYPFLLIFGINNGNKWGPFRANSYASRLCLGLDLERNGLVMFEPDMVAGTEFQVMYRSLDLEYMKPKISALFAELEGRRPVFATYINCAGRAAGYAGLDHEDAVLIQKEIGGRGIPLMGLYTAVEIASVGGRPRGLDWTGVLSVFSVPQ